MRSLVLILLSAACTLSTVAIAAEAPSGKPCIVRIYEAKGGPYIELVAEFSATRSMAEKAFSEATEKRSVVFACRTEEKK